MNPGTSDGDAMRMYRMKARDACLYLFPRVIISALIVAQELLQIAVFYLEGVPAKLAGLVIRSGWQLPLIIFGVSPSAPQQHASTVISSSFCYIGIVVFSVARAKSDISELKQWISSSRRRTTYGQQARNRLPLHTATPSWLTVLDIACSSAPNSPNDQSDEEMRQPELPLQTGEQVVDSTHTANSRGEIQAQEPLPTLPKACSGSPPRLATSLAVDDSYDTIITAIAPLSAIDVDAVADYAPRADEVATYQETLLIEISFLIEIGQDISIFLVAQSDDIKVQSEVILNRKNQALLVRLALEQEGEKWVKHTRLYQIICIDRGLHDASNVESKAVQNAFNQAMNRTRLALQEALDQAVQQISIKAQGPSAQVVLRIRGFESIEAEDGKQPKLTDKGLVFQNKIWGKGDSRWCLSPAWRVRQFEHLTSVYEAINDAPADPSSKRIPITTLRAMIEKVRDEYWGSSRTSKRDRKSSVGGFLSSVLRLEAFAGWVPRYYKRYREMFCIVLTYAAKREYKRGNWNQAGVLYRECVLTATTPPVDAVQSKQSLLACLSVYVENDEDERAEQIYHWYKKRMRRVDAGWEPDAEMAKFLRENYIGEVED